MAYALSLSGLLLTCRHHFIQRPHAQCNSIVSLTSALVTSRLPREHGDCMFQNEWLKDDEFNFKPGLGLGLGCCRWVPGTWGLVGEIP